MSRITPHSIGRYEVVAPLASGGMGELFLARRSGAEGFARLVVLKRLRPELGATATYRDMFFDEARLAARLTHPNVCEVYDLEEHGDDHFLAMPYLEGVPATALLSPPIPGAPPSAEHVRLVAGILVQVLDGLHHAHELRGDDGAPLGVVHRDVSPGNVFVTTDGVVKLLDFGVAKVRGQKAVTEQGVVKGKLAYMAPEQLADGAIDRRADLFCVGILGWEGLMGRPLFAKVSASLTAAAVLDGEIPRLDADGVPPALVSAIGRALAREPHRRPATAAAMREEIEKAMVSVGGVARASEIARVVAERCGAEITAQRERVRKSATTAGMGAGSGTGNRQPATGNRQPATGSGDGVGARDGIVGAGAVRTVGARPDALTTTVWARPTRSRIAWLFAGAMAVALALGIWIVFGATASKGSSDSDSVSVSVSDAVSVSVSDPVSDAGVAADAAAAADAGTGSGGRETGSGGRRTGERQPGSVSIDSTPWAELFIDGKRVGITPYIDKPLAAGKHSVRAVLEDGRSRTFDVNVPEGKRAKPVDLKW